MTANSSSLDKASPDLEETHFSKSEEAWDVYRLLVENSYDLVGELGVDGEYVYVNPSYCTSLGYGQPDLLRKNAFEFVHPQDQEKARREFQQQDGTTILRFRHQNGAWKWFDCSFRQFGTEQGPRTVLISRDISARKEAEIKFDVLASLGSKLSAAKSQVEAARVIAEAAQVLCAWDAFSLDLYNREVDLIHPVLMIDEIEGRKTEIIPEYESRSPSPFVRTVLENGPQRILRKGNDFDNSLRPFGDTARASASLMFVPIIEEGRPLGVVSVQSYRINAYSRSDLKLMQVLAGHCSGTLARIRAVDALAESQARFEAFMENTPAAAWIKDEFGRYIYANQTIESLFPTAREKMMQRTDQELLKPALAEEMQKEDDQVRHSGQPLHMEQNISPESKRRWFICKFPFFSPKGGWYVGGLAFDVTDRELMQRSLRASEEKFRTLFESAPLAIALVRDGTLLYTNSFYRQMFGLAAETGTAGREFLEEIAPGCRGEVGRCLQAKEERLGLQATEVRGLRNEGEEFPALIQIAPVKLPEGAASLVFLIDISEKRALEARLYQSQKMESIGRLAGGIAHDFANLLTVIQGHAARLERGARNAAGSLDGIIRASNKATELTKQLLAFSRKQTIQLEESDLNESAGQVSRLMERVLGEDIALRVHLTPGIPRILADRGLIEQLVLNLGLDAREMMPGGGNLTVSTSYANPQELKVKGSGWEKGAVRLLVEDTGRGIPAEDIPHVFEPFFKRRAGSQSSLRLATVYGIVKQHNGQIEVHSQLGQGTRYEILFPALRAPDVPKGGAAAGAPAETILIVEDSADLRALVREVLNDAGFQTLEAGTVTGSLQLFESARDRISVVVADVFLEDGSGREVVRKIREAKPGVRAILTTGYDPHQVRGEINLQPDEHFLPKPFTNEELLELVEACLRG